MYTVYTQKGENMLQQLNVESSYDFIADHTLREQSGQNQQSNQKMPSPGQRLALAIISLFALILQSIVVMGFLTNSGEPGWPALILAGTLIISIAGAITAINIVFNIRH